MHSNFEWLLAMDLCMRLLNIYMTSGDMMHCEITKHLSMRLITSSLTCVDACMHGQNVEFDHLISGIFLLLGENRRNFEGRLIIQVDILVFFLQTILKCVK